MSRLPTDFTPFQNKLTAPVSAWIGFHVPITEAKKLVILHGGYDPVPPEEMHLTLVYMPQIARNLFNLLVRDVSEWAKYRREVSGQTAGLIRFDSQQNGDETDAVCAHFDSPDLLQFHMSLSNYLTSGKWPVARNHGFTAHITLDYVPDGVPLRVQKVPIVPITFSEIVVSSRELERDVTLRLLGALQVQWPWDGGVTAWKR